MMTPLHNISSNIDIQIISNTCFLKFKVCETYLLLQYGRSDFCSNVMLNSKCTRILLAVASEIMITPLHHISSNIAIQEINNICIFYFRE